MVGVNKQSFIFGHILKVVCKSRVSMLELTYELNTNVDSYFEGIVFEGIVHFECSMWPPITFIP